MDQLEQDLSRFKLPAMAAVGGIAAALVVATLPSVYLEKAIGLTGIAEIVSAAAPPLGNTAKALVALAAGIFSASIIFVFLNKKGGSDMSLAIRKNLTPDPEPVEEPKSKFAMPKFSLKKMLQKPKKKGKVTELADLPQLREVDSHPDAPARRPIFADADLGAPLQDKIKPFEAQAEAPVAEAAAPQVQAAPEVQPAPFVADKALHVEEAQAELLADTPADLNASIAPPVNIPAAPQAASEPVAVAAPPMEAQPAPVEQPVTAPAPAIEQAPAPVAEPQEDLSGLSIGQLADRLETGLDRLKQLERANQVAANAVTAATAPAQASEQPVGGISVSSSEEPTQAPPLKSVEPSAEDVQAARQADMDAALKAALGTLEKMTARR